MRRHIFKELPDNYNLYYHFNVYEDFDILDSLSKAQTLSFLLTLLLGLNIVPFRYFYMEASSKEFGIKILVVLSGNFILMSVHERLHHLLMKAFGSKSAAINHSRAVSYSCSDDYYDKFSYVLIAAFPFILLTGILVALCCILPVKWFWMFYVLIIFSICGSLTDFYAIYKTVSSPKKSLLIDSGTEFKIFSPSGITDE